MSSNIPLPYFLLELATTYPCIKRVGVDTFELTQRLAFDFESQGQELRELTKGIDSNEISDWLQLPKDTLWAVFFGAAQLDPHSGVVKYLKAKIAEKDAQK